MIYIVLGMHKSGTTLMSEVLHKSGINMVEDQNQDKGYYDGNKMERRSSLDLNHEILNSRNVNSLDIQTDLSRYPITDEHKVKMKEIIDQCSADYSDWGMKDPRSCITYPYWDQQLPAHKLLIVYRHPFKVVNHYAKKRKFIKRFLRITKTLNSWKQNNRLLIQIAETTKHDCLVLNYEDFLKKDEILDQISKFIDRPARDARIAKSSKKKKQVSPRWCQIGDMFSSGSALQIYNKLEELKNH